MSTEPHESEPAPAAEASTTGGADAGADATHVQDRRSEQRVEYAGAVGFIPVGPDGTLGTPIPVMGRDVSSGGLSLHSPTPLERGTDAVIQLRHESGRLAILGAKVCHCRPGTDATGGFVIGIAFQGLPAGIDPGRFRDERGRLMLLDARLKDPPAEA